MSDFDQIIEEVNNSSNLSLEMIEKSFQQTLKDYKGDSDPSDASSRYLRMIAWDQQ